MLIAEHCIFAGKMHIYDWETGKGQFSSLGSLFKSWNVVLLVNLFSCISLKNTEEF